MQYDMHSLNRAKLMLAILGPNDGEATIFELIITAVSPVFTMQSHEALAGQETTEIQKGRLAQVMHWT